MARNGRGKRADQCPLIGDKRRNSISDLMTEEGFDQVVVSTVTKRITFPSFSIMYDFN
jgi:hypothetical protein